MIVFREVFVQNCYTLCSHAKMIIHAFTHTPFGIWICICSERMLICCCCEACRHVFNTLAWHQYGTEGGESELYLTPPKGDKYIMCTCGHMNSMLNKYITFLYMFVYDMCMLFYNNTCSYMYIWSLVNKTINKNCALYSFTLSVLCGKLNKH